MAGNNFFEEQKEQSLVKSTIVAKYFDAWANIIIATQKRYPNQTQKLAYIDLFAGPGRYKDGTESTPLMILKRAIENHELRERIVTLFNDKDEENIRSLQNTIHSIPGIEKLTYKPTIEHQEIGENIVKMFEDMTLVPTLFFVDPWGYKGLSMRLINSVLKDWGCDAIFFFNYNRVNMGISNDKVIEHMDALFGSEKTKEIRERILNLNPAQKEMEIVEELCQTIKSYGHKFVLPFSFKNAYGKRTTHHLIFVSKHFRGYEKMKEVMAKESTNNEQGVPSFEYNPADFMPKQSLLFQLSRPLDDLKEELLDIFKGQRITMQEIYETHNVDTPYLKKNYKDVLRELYEKNEIEAITDKGNAPRKGSFGDGNIVTFPK